MSTFVKTIKSFNQDGTSDTIYPVTKADAVYLSDHAEGNVSTAESNINNLNTKVGTASLNTTAQDLSAAINELNDSLNFVESKTINIGSNYTSSITASGGGVHCFQRGDKTALVFGTFTVNTAISASAATDMFTGFPFSVGGTMWVTATHVSSKETVRMQFRNGSSSGVLQQNYTAYATGEYIINPFFYYVTT